jgi:hypothetical protein
MTISIDVEIPNVPHLAQQLKKKWLTPVIQDSSNRKPIYHINRIKKNNHTIILIDIAKHLKKQQFAIKVMLERKFADLCVYFSKEKSWENKCST